MSLNNTPSANRLHVALFGRRNSGKSSLINALTGQNTALVSDIPGTTTDTVSKAMEIQGIGPCLFIDTPGFDDEGELGEMRIIRTLKAIEQTDIALLLCEDEAHEEEKKHPVKKKDQNQKGRCPSEIRFSDSRFQQNLISCLSLSAQRKELV